MKAISKAFILAVMLCILSLPFAVQAADQPGVSVAVVDMQQLMGESKAGKHIQEQLQTKKKTFLEEISKQEQKLREDEKALTGQRASLSQEEFSKKAKEFEARLNETRRKAQDDKRILEESASTALAKLRDEIYAIVQSISDEKGYGLVVNRQNVVVSNKSLDITPQALEMLDKKISEIAL